MKKLLSVFMAIVMMLSMFSVSAIASEDDWDEEWVEEEIVLTLDDVITLFEDAVFISMAGGEMVDSISLLSFENNELVAESYDGMEVYTNKNNYLDEYNQKPLYTAMSIVHKMDVEGYRIADFYYDDYDLNGNQVYIFLLKDTNDNAVWYKAEANWDGYILGYCLNSEKTVDGVTYRTEESHKFEYTENVIYVDSTIFNLGFGEIGEVILTLGPKCDYYITVTGANPEAVECFDGWGYLEIVGRREGSAEVNIVDYDTDEIIKTIFVNVEFTTWDWIVYIFFFGWAWM